MSQYKQPLPVLGQPNSSIGHMLQRVTTPTQPLLPVLRHSFPLQRFTYLSLLPVLRHFEKHSTVQRMLKFKVKYILENQSWPFFFYFNTITVC